MSDTLQQEIYGITPDNYTDASQLGGPVEPFQTSGAPINLGNQNRLQQNVFRPTEWQLRAQRLILGGNDDVFICVPPSAGKTNPVIGSFYRLFTCALDPTHDNTKDKTIDISIDRSFHTCNALRFNGNPRDRNFPRFAVITPTKYLAMQLAENDFKKNDNYGVLAALSKMENLRKIFNIPPDLQSPNQNLNRILDQADISSIYNQLYDIVGSYTGGESTNTNSLTFNKKPVIVGTYEVMSKILESDISYYRTVVIDELQNTVPLPDTANTSKDQFSKYKAYHNIIKTTKAAGKQLVLMTGSMNRETVIELCNFFNDTYGTNFNSNNTIIEFGNTPGNEAKNRASVVIAPFEKMKTFDERLKLCENIIDSKQSNSMITIFATKRTSAQGIFRLSQELVKKLPRRNLESLLDDKLVSVRDFETAGADYVNARNRVNELEKELLNLRRTNNQAQLRTTLAQYATAKSQLDKLKTRPSNYRLEPENNKDTITKFVERENKNYSPTKQPDFSPEILEERPDLTNNDIEELKYFNLDGVENRGEPRLTRPDPNNLLCKAISSGFGFNVGGMSQRQKDIVQKFFRAKKIHLLLVTDSVGIGANLTVKHLYLPTLVKPPDFSKLDTSTLVQLIHRAGRISGMSAFIYCLTEDYDNVKRLFFGDPSREVSRINSIPFGNYKSAKENLSVFNLLNMFMGVFTNGN